MARFVTRAMVVLLLVAVLSTFTACSIFDGLFQIATQKPKVTEVKLSAVSGLDKVTTGKYTATVGEEFSIKITLNTDAPSKPTYKWYVTQDGEKSYLGDKQNKSTLAFTFDEYSDSTYVFSAEVDGVASKNTITVTLNYAVGLSGVAIKSSTHHIVDGAIQQTAGDEENIIFDADWNKSALAEDTEVSFKWTVGTDDTALSTDETFEFLPEGKGEYIVKLTMSDGTNVLTASVVINVIEVFSAVSTATLVFEDGGVEIGEGVTKQYYQEVVDENRDAVTISLSTTPVGATDLGAPVTWTVRNKEGTTVLEEKGREVTFVPAYGENVVTATVGGVTSKHLVLIAFTDSDYTKYQEYIEDVFIWDEGVENGYISDQADLNRLMQYALSTRRVTKVEDGTIKDKSNGFPFATPDSFDVLKDVEHKDALSIALNSQDEAGSFNIRTGWSQLGDEYYDYMLYITDESAFMTPSQHYSPAEDVTQNETAILHYTMLDEDKKRDALPIDDNPEYPTPIADSQMLYRVVGWGYKPVFDGSAESQRTKALYETIRQVAIDYVTDEMTDYEKTLIFYEWIAQKTDYDYAIVEDSSLSIKDKLVFNAFTLEGVFANADGNGYGQAVCDGRAKAFVILCGLEDITAIRVTGQAVVGGTSEGHAWNKVLIDRNGDGVKEWYLCDTTWSDRSSAEDRVEMLNKQYFLVTDKFVEDTHHADEGVFNPPCTTEFDYYANTIIENGTKDFDLYIDSVVELKNAVLYAKENGTLLEIKVHKIIANSESELYTKIKAYAGSSVDSVVMLYASSTYCIFTVVFE